MVQVEVCVDSVASAAAAVEGVARRVEVAAALAVGGVTASAAVVAAVAREVARRRCGTEAFVLLRCRPGHFVYSEHEIAVMQDDARLFAANPDVAGLVVGALRPDGAVDHAALRLLLSAGDEARAAAALPPLSWTFHRAIDVSRDPVESVLELVRQHKRITRVLTSGAAPSAWEGRDTIRRMVAAAAAAAEQAGDRSEPNEAFAVMAGGGLKPELAAALVRYTAVSQLHGSFARAEASPMLLPPGCSMASAASAASSTDAASRASEYDVMVADAELVRRCVQEANTAISS